MSYFDMEHSWDAFTLASISLVAKDWIRCHPGFQASVESSILLDRPSAVSEVPTPSLKRQREVLW